MNQELYFKKLGKALGCAANKKAGVLEDLREDVREALSQGESWEQVMARMGTPEELAGELNENMGVEGKASGKSSVWKIVLAVAGGVLLLLLLAGVLVYRSLPKSYEMGTSGLFDPKTVQASAEEIVELLDAGEFEALQERSVEKMKPIFTEETIAAVREEALGELGAFEKFAGYLAAEVKQGGEIFAMTEVTALYEERSVIYRITFDEDMKLAGIYMR